MQSCYFLVCIGWMWYGITISWAWQTNCIGSIEGFSRSNRYFYQTIMVWSNLNRRFQNDWTYCHPYACEDLSTQNCWQMLQVFIYTDELQNGQLPTYKRCLDATFAGGCHSQTYRCVAWHWIKLMKTCQIWVGLGMTKAGSSQCGQYHQKHQKHAKKLKHCSCKGFCVGDSCTYKKCNLPSTDLCRCQGQCEN